MFTHHKQTIIRLAVIAAFVTVLIMIYAPGIIAQTTTEESTGGTITVVGRGQALGQPDQAQAQVGVETFAVTVQQATQENETTLQAVMKALEMQGIAVEDIQTTNYSLWVEQRYGDNGPEGIVGYHVSNQVNITIRDFSKIGQVLAAVIDAGANNIFGLSFTVADKSALEEEARAKAMADARDRATSLAELGQVELGEIKMISEVINQPPVPQTGLGGGGLALAEAPTPSISPGQLSHEVQVQVTFSIK